MTRILIRAGKSPFVTMDAYDTFDKNVIGNNNGNLLFSNAAHKLLSANNAQVEAHGLRFSPSQAAEVSANFDYFVLPLANAFRKSFEIQLKQLTSFIEKLTIPTVMLSGGAQSGPDGTFDNLESMKGASTAFCRAILKSSSAITVRGHRSAEYIKSLGFSEVEVIGCPSLTTNGPEHRVGKLTSITKLAYNIESSKDATAALVSDAEEHYDATYFPQDIATMEMMLWGIEKYPEKRDSRLPLRAGHAQFSQAKAEFQIDPYTWIQRMKEFDFSFGPRIHGNVVPLLAGTPSVVLAHDSRTQELAEYHAIPHFTPSEFDTVHSVEEVAERADYTAFNQGHADRVQKVVKFLHTNGLKTIYDADQVETRARYERLLAKTEFPQALRAQWATMTSGELARLKRERQAQTDIAKLRSENTRLKQALAKAGATFRELS